MRPERRTPTFPLGWLGARAYVHHQPVGVVGIIGPWNFPVNLLIAPLAGVLAAGNRAFLKPSEHAPATAAMLAELIGQRFDATEIAVVQGDAQVASAFSRLPFDHLLYTGGGEVARHILHAAAEKLTPVTLELGGKSPVLIGRSARRRLAATRLVGGKLLNAGQVCLAPDYVLVPREEVDDWAQALLDATQQMMPAQDTNPDAGAVINERHALRLSEYLQEVQGRGGRVVSTLESSLPDGNRRMPLTLIVDPPADCRVMHEEIFGPLLVLLPYDGIDDALAIINARPRALAVYYFGEDKREIELLKTQTTSGGLVINDVIMHYTIEDLPFGGTGASGMGAYHGIDGFRTFSVRKAVYKQARLDTGALVRPPYTHFKSKLLGLLIRK